MDYVLSLSKWRCGGGDALNLEATGPGDQYYGRGFGTTRLENTEGYMCCLGQFARQVIDASGNDELKAVCDVLPQTDPECLADYIHSKGFNGVYDHSFVYKCDDIQCPYSNETITTHHITTLANLLINFNDDPCLHVAQKIHKIKTALKQYGHTLKVVQ